MSRCRLSLLVVLACGVGLAACGDTGGETGTGGSSAGGKGGSAGRGGVGGTATAGRGGGGGTGGSAAAGTGGGSAAGSGGGAAGAGVAGTGGGTAGASAGSGGRGGGAAGSSAAGTGGGAAGSSAAGNGGRGGAAGSSAAGTGGGAAGSSAAGTGGAAGGGGRGGAAGSGAAGTGGGSAGTGAAGTGAAGTGGGTACNAILSNPTVITETHVAQDLPTNPAGGTITPGTYRLMSYTVYTGVGGATGPDSTRKATTVLTATAGGFTEQYVQQVSSDPEQRFTLTVTPNGTNLTFMVTCPSASTFTWGYTASGDTLTIFNVDSHAIEVHQRVQ